VKPPAGVRLSGGRHRGRHVAVPAGARPTEGRVREALFSIWNERLDGARVLDLFAGSGAVALEALGRGALSALAVDQSAPAIAAIQANAAKLGEPLAFRRLALPEALARMTAEIVGDMGPFDLVFADPPYVFDAYELLLTLAAPLLAADGEIAVEHDARRKLPPHAGPLVATGTRRYGESALSFYRRGPG
jgi:16S rRNA (guanine966-N2)-methyltransferase